MLRFIKKKSRLISGLLFILFSILVLLSLISYDKSDYSNHISITQFSQKVNNYGGRLGALVAFALHSFMGIFSLILPFLLLYWGIQRLAKRKFTDILKITAIITVFFILIATLVSMAGKEISFFLTGEMGLQLALLAQDLFGAVGAYFVVIILFIAFLGFVTGFDFREPFRFTGGIVTGLFRNLKDRRLESRERKQKARESLIQEYKDKQLSRIKRDITLHSPEEKPIPTINPAISSKKEEVREEDVEENIPGNAMEMTFIPPQLVKNPRIRVREMKIDQQRAVSEPESDNLPELDEQWEVRNSEEHKKMEEVLQESDFIEQQPTASLGPVEEYRGSSSSPEDIRVNRFQGSFQQSKNPPKPSMADSASRKIPDFQSPPLSLLNSKPPSEQRISDYELKQQGRLLIDTLRSFGVEGTISEINPGPVITRYELEPAPGVKVNRIVTLADDLALALRAQDIRIVAPIPGKGAVGIEIPNEQPEMVYIREILNTSKFQECKTDLTIALGKTVGGLPFVVDLTKMPHLLIAGATGSGKSVGINTIITSIIYKTSPELVQFIMIDPKRLELSIYNDIPYLRSKVVNEPDDTVLALQWAVDEMERRYILLAEAGVRKIEEYNKKLEQELDIDLEFLPYIVIVIDELADLMSVISSEIETPIARIAQKSRAVGIHLIVATQRPSVDVLTGLIKANFPCRIAFKVRQKVDSRTILDTSGAEKLLGNGDLLYLPPGSADPIRVHGSFISTAETERLVDFLKQFDNPYKEEMLSFREMEARQLESEERDELFFEAAKLVILSQKGSSSLLQRKLRIGYTRAASLIDQLEDACIVGPFRGSKAREVLVDDLDYLDELKAENE
ncbi:DNA translocase FtsK [bacterium]|nr:DNA translocase FtsK [bacterium]